MKTKPIAFLVGLIALAISLARAADDDAAKKDMARLQGEWVMVSGSADGQEMPAEMLKNSKRVCKEDVTTVMVGGQLFMKAKFTLDPSKKPKTIDYDMIDGPSKGKKQLGIYEFDGETVKFCFASPGRERPGEFSGKAGEGRTVSVWKRGKKTE